MEQKGLRYNQDKLKWSLVRFRALEPLVKVLMFGAKKYSPRNWEKGLDRDEILESLQRHVVCLMEGEENDPESGLPHIGHLMCNAMFYSHFNTVNTMDTNQEQKKEAYVLALTETESKEVDELMKRLEVIRKEEDQISKRLRELMYKIDKVS